MAVFAPGANMWSLSRLDGEPPASQGRRRLSNGTQKGLSFKLEGEERRRARHARCNIPCNGAPRDEEITIR